MRNPATWRLMNAFIESGSKSCVMLRLSHRLLSKRGQVVFAPLAKDEHSGAYTDWSATYDLDRNLTRDLDQLVTRDTLSGLRCKSILEIGCGTGKNTPLLAQIGEHVSALDFSAGMIEKSQSEKLSLDNVTFEVADITQPWPCEDRSMDLVVCNLVLEHIPDLSFIFSEASRVLVKTGRFFVSELHPFRQYQGTQAKLPAKSGNDSNSGVRASHLRLHRGGRWK